MIVTISTAGCWSQDRSGFPDVTAGRRMTGGRMAVNRIVAALILATIVPSWEAEARCGQSDRRKLRQDNCLDRGP